MDELGQETVPTSVIAYREMLETVDLTTAAGRELYLSLGAVAPQMLELQTALLSLIGTSTADLAGIIRTGLTGKATAEATAEALQAAVVEGIESALAADAAGKITDLMLGGIINPAIEAILLGGELSAVLSEAHVAGIVAKIEAQAAAFTAVMSDPALQTALAQLRQSMQSISGVVGNAATESSQSGGSQMENLRQAIIDSFQDQLNEAQRLATQFGNIADTLENLYRSLRVSNLSPLSPEEKYREAKAQFEDVSRRAKLGDVDALSQLDGVSRNFLDISKEYYAATSQYAADFSAVEEALRLGAETARRQESIAEEQVRYARSQLDVLGQIKQGQDELTKAMLEAVRTFAANNSAQALLDAAEALYGNGKKTTTGSYIQNQLNGSGAGAEAAKQDTYFYNRWLSGMFYVGMSIDDAYARYQKENGQSVPGFAAGGFHAGGLRLVGEQGPELEVTGPAMYYSAGRTQDFLTTALSGGGGSESLEPVLRELVGLVRALILQNAEGTGQIIGRLDGASQQLEELGSEIRRAA